MGRIGTAQRRYLEDKFAARANFSRTERRLYGHDIAAIPSLIKPLIGDTTPDAVVQPETEEELTDLVRWAASNNVPLTPRGKASSGYGGVLPVKKGVVVDFYRMKRVLGIDAGALTATVQAGVVWEKLDRQLARHGLTLRLYPTSYPSSTVGGWLAHGGAGVGSYEAGWFPDNVVSARVVLPEGTVREFSGPDLALVADAEGITGLISALTIRVQPREDINVVAIGCPVAGNLQCLLQTIVDEKLPIWSISFINPRMAELKNRSPLMEHYGKPADDLVLLPASYIITLAFRARHREAVMGRLPQILKPCKVEVLSDRIAQHEWKHRFKLMVVTRLGPSLVPAEVVIPLAALDDVMTEIERKVAQPIVKEGVLIREGRNGEPEVVLLGFIPSDQRRFSYNLIFALNLTITKIAEKYGGRAYATGLYFHRKAPKVLGRERLQRLKEFKAEVDPRGILNPGKVLGHGLIGSFIGVSGVLEPITRRLANHVIPEIGERPTKPVRGIPADVAWYAYGCSQCGYCIEECSQFYGRGWESQSPRGKWYWLREYMEGRENWSQFMIDTMLVCSTCELCNLRCSAALPIESSWMKLRGELVNHEKQMTFPPFEMMAAALRKEGDVWVGYRKNRDAWFPEDLIEKHGPDHRAKVVYWAGCTASYVEHDISMASVRLLDEAGVDFTYLGKNESCCGTPMLVAGKWDVFEEIMRDNIRAVEDTGAHTVVCSCPACDMMWRHVYPSWAEKLGIEYTLEAKHYSELLAESLQAGRFHFPQDGLQPCRVTWHDSCHIGRDSGVYDPPRQLIAAMPNVELVEMSHNREDALCCGSVLNLVKDPAVAADIGKTRLDEAVEVGAEKLLTLCPCCQLQFRIAANKNQVPVEVVDLARFCACALGYDFPDPNPEVQKQWAAFEAMIALMTPQGFANLMGTMWPELVDAMPFGMGRMMRLMGRIPGTLELMKPAFPILFPRLLPMMMPKVMPVMLQRVGEMVPMPDHMAEQMPDIMPKVIDNIMPHMLGDVVPLVTGPMIDHLRGRNGKQKTREESSQAIGRP